MFYYSKKLTILGCGKYLLPGIKCSSKSNIPINSHEFCLLVTAQLPPIVRSLIKQSSYMVKSTDNAFDHTEFCIKVL